MRFSLIVIALLVFRLTPYAQTVQQNSGWLLLLNNTKFSEKWGLYADMQLRSADKWANVRNLLVRPGITYYANSKNEITLGYLLNQTFLHNAAIADHTLSEHRIWEQYVYKQKISTLSIAHRFRLEQRFIERTGQEDLFAQRLRHFFRVILPLQKGKQSFSEGVFVALQNELLFNVQHKDQLNGRFFDQNRAYAAAGYRFNKHLDMELGYMNQAIKGLSANTMNSIAQLALYTKF